MATLREYILLRTGYTAVTLFFVSLTIFLITQVLPGNAAQTILGQYATPERIELLNEQMGLNEPIYIQYFDWLTGILTGDFGESLIYGLPVTEVILPRLIRSLQLAIVTLTIITIFGITLGVIAAIKNDSNFGSLISGITYLGISVPSFVRAILLLLFLAGPIFNVLPSSGYAGLRTEGVVPWISHLILPVSALSVGGIAHVMRQTRSEMIETLSMDYVRSAEIKGLSKQKVILVHTMRNALLPAITVIALQFGWLMGSLVIVETIFAYPGIGQLVIQAIENRDIPMLQATILIIAISYAGANFVADIVYTKVDPRITYGES
jgi:peptide/nickel transport system permease protein